MNNMGNSTEGFNVQQRERKLYLMSRFVKRDHKNKKTHRTKTTRSIKSHNMRAAGLGLSGLCGRLTDTDGQNSVNLSNERGKWSSLTLKIHFSYEAV